MFSLHGGEVVLSKSKLLQLCLHMDLFILSLMVSGDQVRVVCEWLLMGSV